ncbi:peptidase family M23 family protein [Asticcacaulis biprosthecium C19]|uniref:Peptidase family M23 family protein n=1 Tax=Asticcacaulis biprosthecium C19 TaxID=715226 RepID=F4QJU4_9CAUL|nr:M23 family metallopeptidase [Asticcacaulis biprosthecium]EGF93201.1 peptidase family M23 family protein [Asticcacaulis biprosthecium C19]
MTLRPLVTAAGLALLAACSPPQAETAPSVSVEPVPQPAATQAPGGFSIGSPIACDIGKDCFIQQYPDRDPNTGPVSDYTCGTASYDGHDGTDFRIPDKVAQARGVAVLAVADGVVAGVRDGAPDWEVGAYNQAAVPSDRACGNRVVVVHGNGWHTQYCHMRQGSIAVKDGQKVKAGDKLALVGQAGWAAFPHLHLGVYKDNKPVDPFNLSATCSPTTVTTLWSPSEQEQMAYRGRQVLNAGFAAAPVTMDAIERGGIPAPTASSPALVAYIRAINLQAGDVQTLTIYRPDGKVLKASPPTPLDRNKAQYMLFTGERPTGGTWPKGTYRATYTVTAGTKTVLNQAFTLTLP